MSDTLTGKTRFRTLHRGIWPFNSKKLVLQVEVQFAIPCVIDGRNETLPDWYWRDAEYNDLPLPVRRELFCRENPR